jgi:uncharacterized membrane protein YfhO
MGQERPPMLKNELAPAQIAVTETSLNEVNVHAALAQPGFVVLADAYYPGWQATIDGQPAPLYRANSVTRAVYVPAGEHVIHYRFRPADFYGGAAVSGLAWTAVLVLLLWYWLWGRKTADV